MRPPAFRGLSTEQLKRRGYSGKLATFALTAYFHIGNVSTGLPARGSECGTAEDLLMYDADGNLPPPTRRLR